MTCCSLSVQRESFESCDRLWRTVLEHRVEPTIFDFPTWQKTWWKHFGKGLELRLVSVSSGEAASTLVAPLQLEGGTAAFLGGTDLVDYHDFISPNGAAPEAIEAVLHCLSEDGIERVVLYSVPEGSPTLGIFAQVASANGWEVESEQEDVAPRLELPGSWEEYLAMLRKKDRHELRRKLRRLEAAGAVTHVELTTPNDVGAAMGDFMRLHRMSMPDKAEFMTTEREEFFRDAAGCLAAEGMTCLRFLELDGERVAASLSFICGGVKYLYNSGYNPAHSHLAVGLLNHAYNIQRSIEQGLKVFDFMRGDESYKYHLGGQDRRLFRLTAQRG